MTRLIDDRGRVLPSQGNVTFGDAQTNYYAFAQSSGLDLAKLNFGAIEDPDIELLDDDAKFEVIRRLNEVRDEIRSTKLAALSNGVSYPFFLRASCFGGGDDYGMKLNQIVFPSLVENKRLATELGNPFRVSMIGSANIEGAVIPVPGLGHDRMLQELGEGRDVVGWVFPEAFREYALSSSVARFIQLRDEVTDERSYYQISLTGILDAASALAITPEMFVNPESYSPILCCGGCAHTDPRIALTFKSYGLRTEFWGMSNVLIPGVEQVSEQFTGGISVWVSA